MKYKGTTKEAEQKLNNADTRKGYAPKTRLLIELLSSDISPQMLRELKTEWTQRVQDDYSRTVLSILENVKKVEKPADPTIPDGEKIEKSVSVELRRELREKGISYARGLIYNASCVSDDVISSLKERFKVELHDNSNTFYIFNK